MRLKDTIQKKDFKILVVDDEQGIIDSLAIFLNQYNLVRSNWSFRSNRTCKKRTFWFTDSRFLNDAYTWWSSCWRN